MSSSIVVVDPDDLQIQTGDNSKINLPARRARKLIDQSNHADAAQIKMVLMRLKTKLKLTSPQAPMPPNSAVSFLEQFSQLGFSQSCCPWRPNTTSRLAEESCMVPLEALPMGVEHRKAENIVLLHISSQPNHGMQNGAEHKSTKVWFQCLPKWRLALGPNPWSTPSVLIGNVSALLKNSLELIQITWAKMITES
jgi:hypothetical protein